MNNANRIVEKEYKINEAVLVTYYTLDCLHKRLYTNYPNDINDEIIALISHLENILWSDQENDFPNCDIEDSNFFERVQFAVPTINKD